MTCGELFKNQTVFPDTASINDALNDLYNVEVVEKCVKVS